MLKTFKNLNATSIKEAIQLLQGYGGRAKLNAGGTDLIRVLKDGILPNYPEALINIKAIPGMDVIEKDGQGLKIGALATLADIAQSAIIKDKYSLLTDAAGAVASPQIRNIATIGGNLCQDVHCWYYRYPHHIGGRLICRRKGGKTCYAAKGDNRYHSIFGASNGCIAINPSDMAVALVALGTSATIEGPEGVREVAIENFWDTPWNVVNEDEIVTSILIPKPLEGTRQKYLKFRFRKDLDFPVVSVASIITSDNGKCGDARIVLGAVAPTPVRATKAEQAIRGQAINIETAEEAAEASVKSAAPLSMNAYKVHIIKTLVKQAILP